MNMLIFEESELENGNIFRVRGTRAIHIRNVLKLKAGDTLRIGKLHAGIGRGTVVEMNDEEIIVLAGELEEEVNPPSRELLLAMPRPQSLKKVLQTAACMGVGKIVLMNSAKVEKSYFSSPLLKPEEYQEHIRLGLEQGVSTRAPQVLVLSDRKPRKSTGFAAWLQEIFPEESTRRIVASPAGESSNKPSPLRVRPGDSRTPVFALGPEGGWSDDEIKAFLDFGFETVVLGTRVLRVETAVTAMLAQHDLLLLENSRLGQNS